VTLIKKILGQILNLSGMVLGLAVSGGLWWYYPETFLRLMDANLSLLKSVCHQVFEPGTAARIEIGLRGLLGADSLFVHLEMMAVARLLIGLIARVLFGKAVAARPQTAKA